MRLPLHVHEEVELAICINGEEVVSVCPGRSLPAKTFERAVVHVAGQLSDTSLDTGYTRLNCWDRVSYMHVRPSF